ncbi:MAG TPA: carboxypeptidase-like regulatory domain-containing protein, partial [Planctomycetota bacterium]|nr:carboxypeptidase-like regulatory domain-containing protein [Planctomycetota bacterium]
WTVAGDFPIVVTVSDMKGGVAQKTTIVRVGSPNTSRIAGRVTTGGGTGVMGVTVVAGTLSAVSDSDGAFVIAGVPQGSSTVTATKPGWQLVANGFSNPVTVGPNATGIDFTATLLTSTISGVVTDENLAGIAGVTVSDGTRSVVTSASGAYALPGVPNGTYALTATKSGMTLIPHGWLNPIEVAGANLANRRFSTLPLLSIAATSNASEAGPTSGMFTITCAPAMTTPLFLALSWSGTAEAGDMSHRPTQVTIPANLTSTSFGVRAVDDSLVEGDETIIASIVPNATYRVAASAATVVLSDNDGGSASPVVTIAASDASASETGSATGSITVTRGQATPAGLTVALTWSGTAAAADTAGTRPTSVTIPANHTSAVVVITPVDDSVAEGDETVIATVAAGSGYVVGSPAAATVVIADNDPAAVTIAATDSTATEAGATTATYTITRSLATAAALTVALTWSGTAAAADTAGTRPTSVTIPANHSSAVVVVTPVDDTAAEGDETVIATVAAGSGYVVGSPAAATVRITDNDQIAVTIAASDSTATEAGATTATCTVTRSQSTAAALTVALTWSGTAGAADTSVTRPTSVTIPANQSSAVLVITPVDDTVAEGDETVIATVAAGSGYVVGTPAAATIVITDDDQVRVTIAATDSTATEAASTPGAFTVTRSRAAATHLTVALAWSGTAGAADVGTRPTSITIRGDQASAVIVVTPVDDTLAEGPENVVCAIGPGEGYVLGRSTSGTVTISDDDAVDGPAAAPPVSSTAGGKGGGCGLGSGFAIAAGLMAMLGRRGPVWLFRRTRS